jgi:hypothetical protein
MKYGSLEDGNLKLQKIKISEKLKNKHGGI